MLDMQCSVDKAISTISLREFVVMLLQMTVSCYSARYSRGAQYCDQPVCLSVCLAASISLEPLDRSARNFVSRSPVAVARSSSGGVELCYVLPVL